MPVTVQHANNSAAKPEPEAVDVEPGRHGSVHMHRGTEHVLMQQHKDTPTPEAAPEDKRSKVLGKQLHKIHGQPYQTAKLSPKLQASSMRVHVLGLCLQTPMACAMHLCTHR